MKKVVSISLGSAKRNHKAIDIFMGERIEVERIGTDGDYQKAIKLIQELDGKVDAIGLGGIDLYLYIGSKRHTIRDASRLANNAAITPIVDGSGLKNTLERQVINQLVDLGIEIRNQKVLVVSGVDRFGMVESLIKHGAKVTFGDLIFGLGIPIPITSLKVFQRIAKIIVPIICQVPFKMLYPIGKEQEKIYKKYSRYYHEADIVAGDFHFIKKFLPDDMRGKTIITNTITDDDVIMLRKIGAKTLITTTPEIQGRSFGTNVMEALIIALSNKNKLSEDDYNQILKQLNFRPRIISLEEIPDILQSNERSNYE